MFTCFSTTSHNNPCLINAWAATSWSKSNTFYFLFTRLWFWLNLNATFGLVTLLKERCQTFYSAGPPSLSLWTHTGGRRARKEGREEERGWGWREGGSPLSCPPTQGLRWSPAWVWAKRKAGMRTHTHTGTQKDQNNSFLTPNVKCGKGAWNKRVISKQETSCKQQRGALSVSLKALHNRRDFRRPRKHSLSTWL